MLGECFYFKSPISMFPKDIIGIMIDCKQNNDFWNPGKKLPLSK